MINTPEAFRAKARAWMIPIEREMELMKWTLEQQEAMWNAIVRLAINRQVNAQRRSGGLVSGQEPAGAGREVTSDSEVQLSRPADPSSSEA